MGDPLRGLRFLLCLMLCAAGGVSAQVAPSPSEAAAYQGLHAAAHRGDVHLGHAGVVRQLIAAGAK